MLLAFRWGWRYRSELAPLHAAGAVLGVACWLHAGHRQWSPLVVVIAAVTAAALVAFGARAGLPTLIERLYAAVTTLAAGGWIGAAAIAGPFTTRRRACAHQGTASTAAPMARSCGG